MTVGTMHTLHPGDVALGTRGDRLETLLGSCVAIILTDPRRTLGAMCHIVHASSGTGDQAESTAYAANALSAMYRELASHGINPRMCEAYVYGGGNMFPSMVTSRQHVGQANADWALEALETEGIPVVQQDLGGSRYRRLSWTVGNGVPEVTSVNMEDAE